ncbi:hypothetical protein ACIRU3_41780 [Streptomyces sp. NPDC101151]|uniref:hypothetical protein n=1 Tax=Streptomyces sp. NPDC101151 TaxID=3366115 RepID=UPI0038087893
MYGNQTSAKASLKLGKALELGVESAFQYQHTVSDSTSYTSTTRVGEEVPPYTKGYLQFTPYIAKTKGTLYATYPYNVFGTKEWGTTVTSYAPILIDGTNVPDGEWKIEPVPC